MKLTAGIGALVVCMAAAAGLPSLAHAQHEGGRYWHGGDIRYFHARDFPAWRADFDSGGSSSVWQMGEFRTANRGRF